MLEGVGADGAAIIACAPVAPCIGCDLAACFAPLLPALRAFVLVALDARNDTVKRMQSFLTVQPGETVGCVGCHERRTQTPVGASGQAYTVPPPHAAAFPTRSPTSDPLCRKGRPDMQPQYTALGDSITSGSGASKPWYAYPAQVAARLGAARAARLRHLAAQRQGSLQTRVDVLDHQGWTSAELLAAVCEQPPFPQPAGVISVWVGGDDLAAAGLALLHGANPRVVWQALANYRRNLQQLLAILRRAGCPRILVCTQYNPFPNSPLAVQAMAALNQQTRRLAARHGALLAPTDVWFAGREPELIAGYRQGRLEDVLQSPVLPVHPNDRGHAWIASHLAPLVNHATRGGTS
ncbi:MAG: hypothetical protein K6T31_09925 [Alicyclobacillus sp.]|nr:hypothetical protein [Alicyclobacillus sp.]